MIDITQPNLKVLQCVFFNRLGSFKICANNTLITPNTISNHSLLVSSIQILCKGEIWFSPLKRILQSDVS